MKKFYFVIFLIIVYVYFRSDQISDVEEVCSIFHEGTTVEDFDGIEDTYSVKQIRSFNKNKIEKQTITFCAVLTVCDCSCNLEILNNKVVKAEVVWY